MAKQKGGTTQLGWMPPAIRSKAEGQGGFNLLGAIGSGLMGFATGGVLGAGAAILGSLASDSQRRRELRAARQTEQSVPVSDTYREVQERALRGEGLMSPSMEQAQWRQALAALAAQAQRSRETLGANLASRGLLHSGIYSRAMSDVERARLGGVQNVALGMAQQRLEAQQRALDREAAAQRLQTQLAGQSAMQQRALAAAEPEWWETVAQAAPAIGQYLAMRNQQAPDWRALVRELQGSAATTGSRTRYVEPFPETSTRLSLSRNVPTQTEPWRLSLSEARRRR